MGALALLLSPAVCMAAPVQDRSGSLIVKVGPLVGGVTAYDRVNSRFSLRVGPMRTPDGLSQKIPWFPEPGAKIGLFTFTTGPSTASITVLVRPRPTS